MSFNLLGLTGASRTFADDNAVTMVIDNIIKQNKSAELKIKRIKYICEQLENQCKQQITEGPTKLAVETVVATIRRALED